MEGEQGAQGAQAEIKQEQKPQGEQGAQGGGGVDYGELQKTMAELRQKIADGEANNKTLTEQLEGLKGSTQVVDRLKKALSVEGEGPSEQEVRKAEFYKMLVHNPEEAIRQIIKQDRAAREQEAREERTLKEFENFTAVFPEYKEYEEDMKKELLQNPAWFEKEGFIKKVFYSVLADKNPELLGKLIAEGRDRPEPTGFRFEGSSQSLHGPGPLTGQDIVDRMKAVRPQKSYFE